MTLFDLTGLRALVVGGAGDLGRAMLEGLLEAGARAVAVDIAAKVADLATQWRAQGHDAHGLQVDIRDRNAIKASVHEAVRLLGGPIDILVNAAGIQRRAPSEHFSEQDWDDVLSVNLTAGFVYSQQVAPDMIARGRGKIIHVASIMSQFGGITIPAYADLGSYIARQLADIGLTIQVEVIPKSLLLTQTANGDALFFRASWIADYPDPENFLSVFYGNNPAPPNYTRYRNAEYDRLYEKVIREPDLQQRIHYYREMDQMLIQDAPVVPLWYDQVLRLVQPEVLGFKTNGLNLLDLRKVQIRKQ